MNNGPLVEKMLIYYKGAACAHPERGQGVRTPLKAEKYRAS